MERVKTKILWSAAALMLVAALLMASAGCSPSSNEGTENGEKVLKVGMILPATGLAAEKGKPGGDAVKDAMEYVNTELDGANGYKIEISWRDSAYDNDKVNTIIRDFVNGDELMFTAMSSKEMTAAMTTANRSGLAGMATFAAPNLYNPPEHIYGQMPDYGEDWLAFVNYYMENIWEGPGKPRMALHLLNNTTGSGVRDIAEQRAEELGIELIADEEHRADTINEMDSLTRIRSLDPDVIFISSTPQPSSIILKNAKDLGIMDGDVTIGLAHASFTKSLVDLAGADVAEGVYGVYPTVTWDSDAEGIAKAKEYVMKNNPSDMGNMDYLSCWATSLIVAEALRNAVDAAGYDALKDGDAEARKIVEEQGIQKLDYDVEGIQGPVSYTQGDNRLSKYVKIYTVESGEIVAVSDWVEAR
jgi:branched-chain amino acid transport system substrate-binding protein